MALLRHKPTATVLVHAIQNDPQVLTGVFDLLFDNGRLDRGIALRIAQAALVG